MRILGIESSCDETSFALVSEGIVIEKHLISSQHELHADLRGIVPELASRSHVEKILHLYGDLKSPSYDAIAVTQGPGLIGSLVVGMNFAKMLSYTLSLPFIAVDHIKAHCYAIQLYHPLEYPYLVLLVSGGHSFLALCHDPDSFDLLSVTIDDACGEAFDKVADFLGLDFPGGPALSCLAEQGDSSAYTFPSPFPHSQRPHMSFSGIKTAAIHQRELFRSPTATESPANIAASFERVVCDALVDFLCMMKEKHSIPRAVVCGGVASNAYLRKKIGEHALIPPPELCCDNAAMIAGLGHYYLLEGKKSSLDVRCYSRNPLFRLSRS